MPCEKCPERHAMYCSDADLTLCQSCYEWRADAHAQELEAEARASGLMIDVALESPLTSDPHLIPVINPALTTRH